MEFAVCSRQLDMCGQMLAASEYNKPLRPHFSP
jgi:hypothetical protein